MGRCVRAIGTAEWRQSVNQEIGIRRPDESPLHVLTLTPFYPSQGDDVDGCFVAEPLTALAQSGVFNSVVAVQPIYRRRRVARPTPPIAQWICYLCVPGGWGLSTSGAFLFSRIVGVVRQLHASRPIDVIHAHAPLPCGHAAMLLSRELGIPYTVSVHGLDAYSNVQVPGRAGEWCRRVSQAVFRSAGRVICVSEHVRDQVLTGAGAARVSVVYNGTDPELFAPIGAEDPERQIILSVGNLIPSKGHATLLRALDAMKSKHPDVVCEIVGSGPEESNLRVLAQELKIDRRVHFLGRLGRQELAAAYQRCALFALPSYYEGLGCVYLEAMASQRVAVGCRGQGIDEIIQHQMNGWLIDPENSADLADGLSTLLLNHPVRQTIAARARHTILGSLTLTHQAEQFVDIYREIAS